MIRSLSFALASASMLVCACSSESSSPHSPSPHPPPPAIGAQIDRMGRPAINTATNHTFDADEAAQHAAKEEWNQNADPSSWSKYAPEIGKNLAIYDGLDTVCGNQLFADKTKTDAGRYATLASVLADDRLWVKTGATYCTVYLAVEANATKLGPNGDCGGRKPSYEVIKLTYSAVAAGTLPASGELAAKFGVSDGTTAVAAKTTVATFPYLAPPQ